MSAQAKFIGKTKKTTKAEIAKAYLDAIAYRNFDVYEALTKDVKLKTKQICADGGLSKNKYLMQLQSNLIQLPISIINLESTCMGAIICTGLATKAFTLNNLKFKPNKIFRPSISIKNIQPIIDNWKRIISEYINGVK